MQHITKINLQAVIPEELTSLRLDVALAKLFPQYSRTRLKTWIKDNQVLVDGKILRPRDKVMVGQEIIINASLEPQELWQPQAIELNIVHEDKDIIIINKPAGMVVHPAAGHRSNTMLNGLLNLAPKLQFLPRCGIVHRLDKDTSGLLVIARNLTAHTKLVAALQARTIKREYEAIVHGAMIAGGTIDAPIGRHPKDRKKMAIIDSGKPAVTHYRVIQKFSNHTHLKVMLETGRTHQIRVHMAHIHHPIIGDPLYGSRKWPPFPRQALHAKTLGLIHPTSNEYMQWQTDLPLDMQQLLTTLQNSD